ncbi:MAG TPA: hypothetical protein VFK32_02760 [Tepidiformaceae bacterium]|nr:hypothetical protein [Tepidiformaceae bacterium]
MREIRILAMGGSNVNGFGVEDPADAWPMLVAGALQTAHGHPVTVVRSYLYIEAADPAPFIARRIAEHNPDIIMMNISGPAFVLKTVANSVGRLAGKRMRRALILAEMRLQNAVGSLGDRNVPVRRFLKRGVRKAAGARARISVGEAVVSGRSAIRALAAAEDVASIIRVPLEGASWVAEEQGPAQVEKYMYFRDEMAKAARAARMTYIENTFELTPEEERSVYLPDGIHLTAEGHKAVASLWLPTVLSECERLH